MIGTFFSNSQTMVCHKCLNLSVRSWLNFFFHPFTGPIFEGLANEYPGIEFLKVDVDDAEDVAATCGIQAMPTFILFKDGAKVDEMKGANQQGLVALLEKYK